MSDRIMQIARLAIWCLVVASPWTSLQAGDEDADTPWKITDFGHNPGNLEMYVHVPDSLSPSAPLVVVPHGCFQDVATVVTHSGWIELSDRHGFALLFPATNTENEPFGGCFRTWVRGHQARGEGEPLSLRNQVNWMLERFDLDPERVYMSGQSSGGLFTAVILASYPEIFAAGAIQSAYPYRCADSFEQLAPCSQGQITRSAEAWGDLLREAAPGFTGDRPRVSIWHGADDVLIVPANLDAEVQQWAEVFGIDAEQPVIDRIDGQERRRYSNPAGKVMIESVLVVGLDHAIAIDPDGTPPCGSPAPYIVDVDICAASWIGRWFDIVPATD